VIKVPLYKPLDISYNHPLTSEVSSFYKPRVDEWVVPQLAEDTNDEKGKEFNEMNIINNSLRSCSIRVREEMFSPLYNINRMIIDALKRVEGILHYEDKNEIKSFFIASYTFRNNDKISFRGLLS
jgi:hypothetical protein